MGSNAISQNAVSAVVGVLLAKSYNNTSTPNLPQSISIFGQANTANQAGLSINPVQITSAKQAATLFGDGSPIHASARIFFPLSGANVPVPVYVYPQLAAVGGVAKVITVTPTGTASTGGTVYLTVCGRQTLDGASYAVNIAAGDTPTIQCDKMRAAVAAALGCPVLGTGTTTFIGTAKFVGLESNDINIFVDTTGTTMTGTTYASVTTTPGSGTAAVSSSLALFGNNWNTLVCNTYGLVSAVMDEFEAFNGIPDPVIPTGRYFGSIWRPLFAFSGTKLDDPTTITSAGARPNNVTIVPCVAPLTDGMPYEAAANALYLFATLAQSAPHGDVLGQSYPDMPPPPAGSIPQMNTQSFREVCVNKGCSTVDFTGGVYKIVDLVTTYNPAGEIPPFYRYPRDLNIYWNIKFGYYLLVQTRLVGKTLTNDTAVVTVTGVTKPKIWKADVIEYITDLESRALIADKGRSIKGLVVNISGTNPNRLETEFPVDITGIARVIPTTIYGGFNFGG